MKWLGCSTSVVLIYLITRYGHLQTSSLRTFPNAVFSQVFFSYAILTPTDCTLFLRPESTTSAVHDYLVASDVRVEAYDKVWDALKALGSGVSSSTSGEKTADKEDQGKVLIGNRTSWAVVEAIGKDSVKAVKSPVMDAKSIKNEVSVWTSPQVDGDADWGVFSRLDQTEIEGFRHCHIRDGAALVSGLLAG